MKPLTIIAFQHKESNDERNLFISRLKEQSSQNFNLFIINEINDFDTDIITNFDYYTLLETKYVGDWGQTSKYKVSTLIDSKYVCYPNVDSFYDNLFVEKMIGKIVEEDADIVYCDMNTPAKFITSLEVCKIDVGGFIVRRELVVQDGWVNRGQTGDGKLIKRLILNGAKGVKINEDLYSKR